ncbi:MAG: PIG-L family deacetylase, partial [Bacteroidota bacterium]
MLTLFRRGWPLLLILFLVSASLNAQAPLPARNAAEIQEMLKKLNVLGSVLYVAAHPDDENQRLITYFARERGYRTAYISLTRGDGGQNLIGDEKGSLLGVLRTQELLGARRIDGGEQWFSRALDFGYSKNPEETFNIWDRDAVLADMVWSIRKFRPDVIVTRFPGPEKGGGGHGHHTASFILAKEAFSLASDETAYPEQLKYVETWQAKRLLWNTWRPDAKRAKVISVDIGAYNPVIGRSYGEVASLARSMHKCQAFGAALIRGSRMEHMEFELGDEPENDIFDDINATWERVEGGEQISKCLAKAYDEFNPRVPEKTIPHLINAYKAMKGRDGYWIEVKR